jgi:putative RNA 2'-phosphotransferase
MKKLIGLLSLVLKHRPEEIGLTLDPKGWARVDELLTCLNKKHGPFTCADLEKLVNSHEPRRFSFTDDGTAIRANEGHSIEIELVAVPKKPPEFLYHGTATRFMDLIEREGLSKMSRQQVHLSRGIRPAHDAGEKHGKPIILEISSNVMHNHGHQFFLSENGVWLTESVPPDYLTRRFSL